MSSSPWIIEVTTETFEQAVIERSTEIPVVVDFWAAWCGPCRQLAPVLESLAEVYSGKFLLAKVDIEAEPQLAAAFRVQSIPHVVAIRDKQLVDQFLGALPEPQLREWLDRIVPSLADGLLAEGQALESSDVAAAEARYRDALGHEPDHAPAKIALARLLHAQQKTGEAHQLLSELKARGFLEPEAERLSALFDVEAAAQASGGVEEARQAADADPENLSLQITLADALAATGQYAEAMDRCLSVIQRDKAGAGVRAKEAMLKFLNLIPGDSDLAGEYRRKLASALY